MLCSPDELLGNAREPLGSTRGSWVIPGSPCGPQAGAGGTDALLSLRRDGHLAPLGSDFPLVRLN